MMTKKKGIMKRGFTLMEMMIVLFIIGLIVGLAFPGVNRTLLMNKMTKAKAGLRSVQVAVENYYLNHGNLYPLTLSELITAVPSVMKSLPSDPFSTPGGGFGYCCAPARKFYVIYSVGSLGNGSAIVDDNGLLSENTPQSCIFVSNIQEDTQP